LCNNSDLSKIKNRSFGLELENKQFYFYINEEFKKGQEVEYQYTNEPHNLFLFHHYGFFIKNNLFNFSVGSFQLFKPQLNKEKNQILSNFKLANFKTFVEAPLSVRSYELKIKLYPDRINIDLLKILRVYYWDGVVLSNDDTQLSKLEYGIFTNNIISKDNELKALLDYKFNLIQNNIKNSELSFIEIIKSLEYSKSYINANKNTLNNTEINKFEIRSKVFELCKEDKIIKIRNSILIDLNIKEVLSDQFNKLKDLYTNHEFIKQNLSKKNRNN